jgi:hypothetical protein
MNSSTRALLCAPFCSSFEREHVSADGAFEQNVHNFSYAGWMYSGRGSAVELGHVGSNGLAALSF